jgi:hypothetical protein
MREAEKHGERVTNFGVLTNPSISHNPLGFAVSINGKLEAVFTLKQIEKALYEYRKLTLRKDLYRG